MNFKSILGIRFLTGSMGLVGLAALSACGKKADKTDTPAPQSVSWKETVGFYKMTSEKALAMDFKFFIITADGSYFSLKEKSPSEFERAYQGEISQASFTFVNEEFSSAETKGNRLAVDSADIPESLKRLARMNIKSSTLRNALLERGLGLEFRLERNIPSFSENQETILDNLILSVDDLATLMKAKNTTSLWVNDYTNTDFYTKDKHFHLPAGISAPAVEVVSSLKSGILVVESF